MDDDQPATAENIIHALSQFGAEHEQDHGHASIQLDPYSTLLSNQEVDDSHDLGGLSRGELEAEVLKLRGLVYQDSLPSVDHAKAAKRKRRDGSKTSGKNSIDVKTGKRVEKGRKTELYKAIRQSMRGFMGKERETDSLPAPRLAESSTSDHPVWVVPDWQAPIGDVANIRWMESIANDLYQNLQSEINPYSKVEDIDKDPATILEAVKVTFANYVKRYKAENDSTHAERKARYAKNRRRWARKDLEKRSKARTHLSPSHPFSSLPPESLLFTYQSSEHSSSGSDSSDSDDEFHLEKVRRRKQIWEGMRNTDAGIGPSHLTGEREGKEYGWGIGLKTKVLEVRTPSWRSDKLNEYYAHLDSLSDLHAQHRNTPRSQSRSTTTSATIKAGHVAPSHRRFTLPPELRRRGPEGRKGRKRTAAGDDPENGEGNRGEEWMWESGTVGVWPSKTTIPVNSNSGAESMSFTNS